MIIFKKIDDIKSYLSAQGSEGRTVGFVPTMGALHKGHVSLLERARANGDLTVVSIFVNPTQFNDKKDFEAYPISISEDIEMLDKAGCDVIFIPHVDEIYPPASPQPPVYELGYIDTILEGANRPGHFKGVGQVVARLLEIVMPNRLYLGQKDFQQCMVIKQLVGQVPSLNSIQVEICPTVREDDGLAMSSRNRRLTDPQRALSTLLYQCLVSIQAKAGIDSFAKVQKECIDILVDKGLEPEYVALADAHTLELMDDYDSNRQQVALVAARIGNVRLIDNMLIKPVA